MLALFKRPLPGDVDQLPNFFCLHSSELRQHILPRIMRSEVARLTLAFGIFQLVGKVGGLGIDAWGC